MTPEIIDRGRGPEIAGTRITVYDILDYVEDGWHHTAIAAWLRLSSEEVLTAIRYIEQHREEVMAQYRRMLEFAAAGNPPEIRAKLEQSHARLQQKLQEIQQRKAQEASGAGAPGGR